MDSSTLSDRIDEAASLEFLAEMVRFKSYSASPGERDLARHMVACMDRLGLDANLMPVGADRFNAVGRLPGAGDGTSLMFNGHLDTNPATDDWTVDPWGGLYDDDFIYGIGVSNMKAGDAAAFCAVKTIVDAGIRLKGDVILEYVVGEPQGGIGTVQAIEDGLRADCFINMEPTDLNGLTLHAGAFNYVVELFGETRHVSNRENAVDAIRAACELVPILDDMVFSGATSDDHASVNRCNVGVLRGSLTQDFHDWRPPQVADYARLVGTARYASSQSEDSVMADLRDALDRIEARIPGLKAVLTKEAEGEHPRMLPFESAHDVPIVKTVASAYREVTGSDQVLGPVKPYCFFGTDAAHLLHKAGMPGIVCGPGGRYNTMPDERVDIPDYFNMIRIYLRSILDTCGVA